MTGHHLHKTHKKASLPSSFGKEARYRHLFIHLYDTFRVFAQNPTGCCLLHNAYIISQAFSLRRASASMDHDPSAPVLCIFMLRSSMVLHTSAFYCHVPTTLFLYAFISLHFYYIKREEKEKAGGKTRQLTGKNNTIPYSSNKECGMISMLTRYIVFEIDSTREAESP